METATLLFIIIAFIIALLIAFFQYLFKNKKESQLNYWLSFLRFLSVFSILLILINPTFINEEVEIEKPKLIVAVDNSKSIKNNHQENKILNIVNDFKTNIDLNDKFDIDYFSFGQEFKLLDTLKFNETQTNPITLFSRIKKIYKKALTPVVIISDGNQTSGNDIEYVNYNSPVYPIVIGDTTAVDDIYVGQLNVNKYTFLNNQFPVEVFVNYVGNKNVSKKINILKGGVKVHSSSLSFSKSKQVQTVSLLLNANEKGAQFYEVSIEALDNEQNKSNNSKSFSIDVIEEQSKIAIVSSVLHPDLGMLKKSIESNKQRSVSVQNIADFKNAISEYQLIILYQPTSDFKKLFEEILLKHLNYFIISGLKTDWRFLNNAQNYFSKKTISATENFRPIYNSNFSIFSTNDIGFSNFPPLESQFGELSFSVPHSSLLYQEIAGVQIDQSLLATFEIGSQRAAILQGENSWRWRMSSFQDSKSFEIFDGFIGNLMQYLSSNFKSKKLNVSVNPFYYANETISISASFLDNNLNFNSKAKIWITVTNPNKNFVKRIPFALSNNRFLANLNDLPFGEYSYLVNVENNNESTSGKFKVLPFNVEQQFTQSNNQSLNRLAAKTDGTIYYNSANELIIELSEEDRFKSIQTIKTNTQFLINWKWLLGFIVMLLSVEWFVRKYHGKI